MVKKSHAKSEESHDQGGTEPVTPDMGLMVGDTVHYYTQDTSLQYHGHDESGPYAAIVTRVHPSDGTVDLFVIPAGDPFVRPYDRMGVHWGAPDTSSSETPAPQEWAQMRSMNTAPLEMEKV